MRRSSLGPAWLGLARLGFTGHSICKPVQYQIAEYPTTREFRYLLVEFLVTHDRRWQWCHNEATVTLPFRFAQGARPSTRILVHMQLEAQ
jgi:hypothetical protein